MNKRALKIFFKDGTNTTYKIKDMWIHEVIDEIKYAMAGKLPYVLNFNDVNGSDDILIISTENIKYIRIVDGLNKAKKENKD